MRTKENPDAMQVCLNGHLITNRYHDWAPDRRDFHDQCGAATIYTCPTCGAEIPGAYTNARKSNVDVKRVPKFCEKCGSAFPWTERRTQEADDHDRPVRDTAGTTHFFISYSHHDQDFAELLVARLRAADLESWVDDERLEVGENWRDGIDEAIRNAAALVVVMSPEAKASEYVTYEWGFALGSGVPVVPLMVKKTVVHPRLEPLQYLDFCITAARPWDRLVSRLGTLLCAKWARQIRRQITAGSNLPQ